MKPFFRQIAIVATSLILIAQTCALTSCGSKTDLQEKTIPYAVKLWAQELEAMHIVPRLVFE